MQILGHSTGTALLTVLVGFCAVACLYSGVWGLRGRSVWMPDSGPLDGALVMRPEGTTATGRHARLAGAALLVIGAVFVGLAVHVWRANTY
jgi:hypothetical protein